MDGWKSRSRCIHMFCVRRTRSSFKAGCVSCGLRRLHPSLQTLYRIMRMQGFSVLYAAFSILSITAPNLLSCSHLFEPDGGWSCLFIYKTDISKCTYVLCMDSLYMFWKCQCLTFNSWSETVSRDGTLKFNTAFPDCYNFCKNWGHMHQPAHLGTETASQEGNFSPGLVLLQSIAWFVRLNERLKQYCIFTHPPMKVTKVNSIVEQSPKCQGPRASMKASTSLLRDT